MVVTRAASVVLEVTVEMEDAVGMERAAAARLVAQVGAPVAKASRNR